MSTILGPKRDEVKGEWKIPPDEQPDDLYSSPNMIRIIKLRIIRWAVHVARFGERRGAYRILVGKSEVTRQHGKSKHR